MPEAAADSGEACRVISSLAVGVEPSKIDFVMENATTNRDVIDFHISGAISLKNKQFQVRLRVEGLESHF